ncbi:MAG: aspartate 1-decarboxylase [Kiritimatiellae bacterium]|nr:aspartate 1-decarboxylase [Kiritimatiellia bacterium]
MLLSMLKAKLHCARTTECNRDYEGSLLIDQDLMDAVKIVPYEKILVANVENGKRGETYAIPGERGAGEIGLNGGMAHLAAVGDRLIILAFALVEKDKVSAHHPLVVILDENNKPIAG